MLFGYITSHPCFCKKTQVPFGWALEYTPKKTAIELGKFFFFPIRMTRYLIFRYKKHIQVYLQFMLEVSFHKKSLHRLPRRSVVAMQTPRTLATRALVEAGFCGAVDPVLGI